MVEAEQEAARIAEERAAWEEEKATIAETQSFSGGKVVLGRRHTVGAHAIDHEWADTRLT